MIYPEEIIIKELMHEYKYTPQQAETILNQYKNKGKYNNLCELIEHKMTNILILEEMHDV